MLKDKKAVIFIINAAVSVTLTVISFIFLPQTVITQFSTTSNAVTQMPKAIAILIPTALGIGGSVAGIIFRTDKKASDKCLIVCGAGLLVYILMLAVNLV